MRRLAIGLLALLAAACTTRTDLAYTPSPQSRGLIARAPLIAGIAVTDRRKEAPNRLATVLGGYGNPLGMLDTGVPVKDEVARVFATALALRGDLAPDGSGPYLLRLELRTFDADHYLRSQARIDVGLEIVDRRGGGVIYADAARDQAVTGPDFFGGTSSLDLGHLASAILNRTVDRLLDNPTFQALMGAR